jgi:hypothetical protein
MKINNFKSLFDKELDVAVPVVQEKLITVEAPQTLAILLEKKMDSDDEIVRQALVEVWSKMLKDYAKPGVLIPDVEIMREELLDAGTEAAVKALKKAHWWLCGWMVEDKIEKQIDEGLDKFNLVDFLEEVKEVQEDPTLMEKMLEKIKTHVLNF